MEVPHSGGATPTENDLSCEAAAEEPSDPDHEEQNESACASPSPRTSNLRPTEPLIISYFDAKSRNLRCVVPSCSLELSVEPHFSFPKDKALCLKWLLAIPQGGWALSEQSVVCSRHFEKDDFVGEGSNVTLSSTAIPKMFLADLPTPSNEEVTTISLSANDEGDLTIAEPTSIEITMLNEDESGCNKNSGDSSESDLEIIEPEIETLEVSDTSDEEFGPTKASHVKLEPSTSVEALQESLSGDELENQFSDPSHKFFQHQELRLTDLSQRAQHQTLQLTPRLQYEGNTAADNKSHASTNGVIRDPKIKCCVPRCGSVSGNPKKIGFHLFPRIGETRLSVKSLDNKVTYHDLFSMWKSLLSVSVIDGNSYVCTRHFTPNDYTGNFLNKAAVPTQYLPTPVMFAPFRAVAETTTSTPVPPPLVLINKKPPAPVVKRSNITILPPHNKTSPTASKFIRIPFSLKTTLTSGVMRVNSKPNVVPTFNSRSILASAITPLTVKTQESGPTSAPTLLPQPVSPTIKLTCSITGCSDEGASRTLFRLPNGIDKCKEWVYTCGHPEWLDKGMAYAQGTYRICSHHFTSDMFIDESRRLLKGTAKPTVDVQEPYKKCVINTCQNYFDKQRLYLIGVEFSNFPEDIELRRRWIKAVKNLKGVTPESIEVSEEELDAHKDSVICSLHFRNWDYVQVGNAKVLHSTAVPSMNLVIGEKVPASATRTSAAMSQGISPRKTWARGRPRMRNRGANSRGYSGQGRGSAGLSRAAAGYGNELSENPSIQEQPRLVESRGRRQRSFGRRRRGGRRGRIASRRLLPPPEGLPEPDQAQQPPTAQIEGEVGEGLGREEVPNQSEAVEEETSAQVRRRGNKRRGDEEVVYSRTGRPLRSTTVKRKYITDSEVSEEDEPLSKRLEVHRGRGRGRGGRRTGGWSVEEEESLPEQSVRRSRRVAVLNRKSLADQSDSSESMEEAAESANDRVATEDNPPSPTEDNSREGTQGDVIRESRLEGITENEHQVNDTPEALSSEINESKEENDVNEDKKLCGGEVEENEVHNDEEGQRESENKPEYDEERQEKELPPTTTCNTTTDPKTNDDISNGLTEQPNDHQQVDPTNAESDNPNPISSDDLPTDKIVENGTKEESCDENSVPFGPVLPRPTRADVDFFRSILPTLSKFNPDQKSALKSTVSSKLKELLCENVELLN